MREKTEEILPIDIDPLRDVYRETIGHSPAHQKKLAAGDAALLTIDLQYLDAARGYGVFAEGASSGVSPEAQEYYFETLESRVLPNVRRLQDTFRGAGLEVIHIRIQALTRDGRDRGLGHKRLNLLAAPGSKEAEFLPEVAPVGDEIVINKTSSGVFSTTNLYYVLKNMNISALFVAGVYTNECVDTTVRAACDLGFYVTLVEDGCATVTPALHEATISTLRDRYARVMTTEQALREVERFAAEGGETG